MRTQPTRLLARVLLLAALVVVLTGWVCPAASAQDEVPAAPPRPGWQWPIEPATVVRGFSAPDQPYGAGHRGVDLAADPRDQVVAAAAGVVSVAGWVAGRPLVVIDHGNDLRTTYEPVDPAVVVGDEVRSGEPIGSLAAAPLHCGWSTCLHWGLRDGDRYLDPLTMVDRGPPRLLPLGPVWGGPTGSWLTAREPSSGVTPASGATTRTSPDGQVRVPVAAVGLLGGLAAGAAAVGSRLRRRN